MQVKFAIPAKIQKITRVEKDPSTDKTSENYDKGFQAGYQAGQWQAALEQKKWAQKHQAELEQALQSLLQLKEETQNLITSDFPQLLQIVFERLLKKNPFTPDQVASEIQAFLHELSEAQSIRIECAPKDLQDIQSACEKTGLNFGQGSLQWKTNADLHQGEYRIQSDLGSVDGRLLPKLTKLKLALEPKP